MSERTNRTAVGIIANPAAGKDIRRLVTHASVSDNNEKANIVRRVLLGLEAAGVDDVLFMPDHFGIGARALDGVNLGLRGQFLEMPLEFSQADSTLAAERMRAAGVRCIVTLGGDGTNRAVAKTCGPVPLLPISTGTNNVFPYMIEGTIAGLAAGVVARGIVDLSPVTHTTPRLEILCDGRLIDIALVDAVVYEGLFVGARAIWDETRVRQIVLARAAPDHIGLSSVGGNLDRLTPGPGQGLAIEAGDGPLQVLAPIGPGLIHWVRVASYRPLRPGETVDVSPGAAVLALDGEREVEIQPEQRLQVRVSDAGPRVVDVQMALRQAAERGFFVRRTGGAKSSNL